MKIRYYKTPYEGRNDDRFKMLADMLDNDKECDHLKPRILHLADLYSESGYCYLSVIVVWE